MEHFDERQDRRTESDRARGKSGDVSRAPDGGAAFAPLSTPRPWVMARCLVAASARCAD